MNHRENDPYPGRSGEQGPEWGSYHHRWFRRWERPFGRPKERYQPKRESRGSRWLSRVRRAMGAAAR